MENTNGRDKEKISIFIDILIVHTLGGSGLNAGGGLGSRSTSLLLAPFS